MLKYCKWTLYLFRRKASISNTLKCKHALFKCLGRGLSRRLTPRSMLDTNIVEAKPRKCHDIDFAVHLHFLMHLAVHIILVHMITFNYQPVVYIWIKLCNLILNPSNKLHITVLWDSTFMEYIIV